MDLFEIDQTQHLRREDAAARLHALADALAQHNSVEFERNGRRINVHVPDEVKLKIEVEIGDGPSGSFRSVGVGLPPDAFV